MRMIADGAAGTGIQTDDTTRVKLLLPGLVAAVAKVDARRRAPFLRNQLLERHALAVPFDQDLDRRTLDALVGLGVARILALVPRRRRQILPAPRPERIERQPNVVIADRTDEQRPQLRPTAVPH